MWEEADGLYVKMVGCLAWQAGDYEGASAGLSLTKFGHVQDLG